MAMFQIDDRDINKLEHDLKIANDRAFPFATKNTINKAAFIARSISQSTIRNKMTTRNQWTEKSIQVEKTNTLNIREQEAAVGSRADYMEDQEFGTVKTKGGKEGVPIPTAFSSGEGRARHRGRLPRKPHKLRNIQLRKLRGRKPKNKKQEHTFKVQEAVLSGQRLYYHEFDSGSKGIFRVKGGSKKFKKGWPKGATIEMVYDMSRPTVRIPATPWLKPSVEKTIPHVARVYKKSLQFQLDRYRLFK